MPTYQYACTACDERLEAVQSFTDAPLTQCPACSGALRKVFSAVGVVFKGSGFYKTDSRGKTNGAAKTEKSDKPDAAAAKADSSSSSSSSGNSSSSPASSSPAASSSSSSSSSTPAGSGAKTA